MCELAARAMRGVAVCTAEAELADDPLVGKTARTLEHLQRSTPTTASRSWSGADILPDTDKWYRWDRVKELARVIVVGRRGLSAGAAGAPTLPGHLVAPLVRERLAQRRGRLRARAAEVREYVEGRGLYR